MFFGKISFFILGVFALAALVMQINTWRDRKKFNKEWSQFGYNVEVYLPDRIKSAFPDVESVEIQRLQDLYKSVYAKGTKHTKGFSPRSLGSENRCYLRRCRRKATPSPCHRVYMIV